MEASLDVTAARLLAAWVAALDELHAAAGRATREIDPAAGIAVLHLLDERARQAFAAYRAVVLRD